MSDGLQRLLWSLYFLADLATTGFLIWEDWDDMTWWNWIIIVPIDIFLGTIWPIYWLILRPLTA